MKFDDIKKIINDLAADMPRSNSGTSFKRTIDTKKIKGVIDVSFDDEVKVPKEKFKEAPIIKDYRYWILKLDRYYKNPAMKVNQLNVASLKMYAKLCDRLEAELNKEGTTVARHVSKLRRESVNYDLYYTLYRLAETTVLNFYNPLSKRTQDRSLKILEQNTSHEIRNIIVSEIDKLTKGLAPANNETRKYFNLTANNKVSLWWDPDGSLRAKHDLTKDEELAINQITKRSNVLWKNDKARLLLIDLYVETLAALFKNKDIPTANLVRILSPYNFSKIALDNIMLISESNLRSKFSFYTSINTSKAEEFLMDIEDGRLYDFIMDFQDDYLTNKAYPIIDDINEDYFRKNPTKVKDYLTYLKNKDIEYIIDELKFISDADNFEKILNALIKDDNEDLKIIGLYFIYALGLDNNSNRKVLFDIIRAENLDDFIELINNYDLDTDLIEKIKVLKNPKLKRISIDNEVIDKSRNELKDTVTLINQFIEEDELEDAETIEEEQIQNDNPYIEILSKIISEGFVGVDEATKLAKENNITLNTYIGEINDSLFHYIGDQTLVIDGDRIVIDEFYVDMIKEYINGN